MRGVKFPKTWRDNEKVRNLESNGTRQPTNVTPDFSSAIHRGTVPRSKSDKKSGVTLRVDQRSHKTCRDRSEKVLHFLGASPRAGPLDRHAEHEKRRRSDAQPEPKAMPFSRRRKKSGSGPASHGVSEKALAAARSNLDAAYLARQVRAAATI